MSNSTKTLPKHSPAHPSDTEHSMATMVVLWLMVLAICVVFGNAWAAEIVGKLITGGL